MANMNINVIKICSPLHAKNKKLIKDNDNFIEEINNQLINDDLILKENAIDAPFSVVLVESGGSESVFIKKFKNLSSPLILINNGQNNSLAASLEIKSYCFQHKCFAIVLTGEEEYIASVLKETSIMLGAKSTLKGQNLGVVGEPSDWLIASKVDYGKVYELFGINIVKIGMDEFFKEINKKKMEEIPHFDKLHQKYDDVKTLDDALYIYSALKRLCLKYRLNGLTVRCFDLLDKYKNTSCLALALLNDEGITATCEGDVPSMLTMHILKALTGLPSFQANPSYVNLNKNSIIFAHCTLPLNMVNSYSLTTHFESGLGIGIKGDLPLGKISICKLAPDLSIENSLAISGTIKENLSLSNYCRTQILVEPDESGLLNIFNNNYGNHVIITYADVADNFITFLNFVYAEEKSKRKA